MELISVQGVIVLRGDERVHDGDAECSSPPRRVARRAPGARSTAEPGDDAGPAAPQAPPDTKRASVHHRAGTPFEPRNLNRARTGTDRWLRNHIRPIQALGLSVIIAKAE
jgi:hypothetical protein